ncbi:nitroreductase family deazaflavin-dependent oxidoreductase [Nonomuraea sp. NPDC002799]
MGSSDEVYDSPTGWVAEHIREYVESDGKRGQRKWGVDMLLLTTRGRKSGKLRRTALIYGEDGGGEDSGGGTGRYVVVGSNGGSATHPAWYLNVLDHPEVHVQVGAETFDAHARTVGGADRARLWLQMAALFPQYDVYRDKTTREIPVVILERLPAGADRPARTAP